MISAFSFTSTFPEKLLTLLRDDGQLQVNCVEPFTELLLSIASTEDLAISIAVLQRTKDELCLDIFIEIGGLRVMKFWLRRALQENKHAQIQLILRFLKGIKFQGNPLKRSGIIDAVHQVSSNAEVDPAIAKFAQNLLQVWEESDRGTINSGFDDSIESSHLKEVDDAHVSSILGDTSRVGTKRSREEEKENNFEDPEKREKAEKWAKFSNLVTEIGVKTKPEKWSVPKPESQDAEINTELAIPSAVIAIKQDSLLDDLYQDEINVDSLPPELLPPPPPPVPTFVPPVIEEEELHVDVYEPTEPIEEDSTEKSHFDIDSDVPTPSSPLIDLNSSQEADIEESPPSSPFQAAQLASSPNELEGESPLVYKEQEFSDDEFYKPVKIDDTGKNSMADAEEYDPFEDEESPEHKGSDEEDRDDSFPEGENIQPENQDLEKRALEEGVLKSALKKEGSSKGEREKCVDWRDRTGKELNFFRLFDEFEPSTVYEVSDSSSLHTVKKEDDEVHEKIRDLARQEHLAEKQLLQAERAANSSGEDWFGAIRIIEPTCVWKRPGRHQTPFAELVSLMTDEVREQLRRLSRRQEATYSLPSQIPWTPQDPEGYMEIEEGYEEDTAEAEIPLIPLGTFFNNETPHAFSEFRDLPGSLRNLDPVYLKFWVENQELFQCIILPNGQVDEEALNIGLSILKKNGVSPSTSKWEGAPVDEDGDLLMEDANAKQSEQKTPEKEWQWHESTQGKELMDQTVQMMTNFHTTLRQSITIYQGCREISGHLSAPTLSTAASTTNKPALSASSLAGANIVLYPKLQPLTVPALPTQLTFQPQALSDLQVSQSLLQSNQPAQSQFQNLGLVNYTVKSNEEADTSAQVPVTAQPYQQQPLLENSQIVLSALTPEQYALQKEKLESEIAHLQRQLHEPEIASVAPVQNPSESQAQFLSQFFTQQRANNQQTFSIQPQGVIQPAQHSVINPHLQQHQQITAQMLPQAHFDLLIQPPQLQQSPQHQVFSANPLSQQFTFQNPT